MASSGAAAVLLTGPGLQKCKVSSVLNGSSAEFGGKNVFDGDDSTCWNSDQVLIDSQIAGLSNNQLCREVLSI
jgi:hypothetical protein